MTLAVWQGRKTPLQLGLKSCSADMWVNNPDMFGQPDRVAKQLALKASLLETHLPEIFVALPEAMDACSVLGGLIADWCHTSLPADEHPLLASGRLVADDLLLLSNDDTAGNWILKAALLAFPSHWQLSTKIGKPMRAIHAPVPAYADKLESPVNRFFDMMQIDTISYRLNWTLQVGDTIFTPHPSENEIKDPEDIPTNLFVRSERQTFRKLPQPAGRLNSDWIVFGIGTHIAPIGLWKDNPTALRDLQLSISALSPEMKAYRGVRHYEDAFHKWVDNL